MGNTTSSPVEASLTEKNIGNQSGKVFLITGSTSGIGRELAHILYAANAKVWIAARSGEKAERTIADIRKASPTSTGSLKFLHVDFNDLKTINVAAQELLRSETKLDVLWNNAGIMIPPEGTKTAQGYEAQLGTNTIAPFLFTKLIAPLLINSAARVVWVSSSAAANFAPKGGVDLEALRSPNSKKFSQWQYYGVSKAGNILHSAEFARRYADKNTTSVAIDPGNLQTDLYQHMPRWQHFLARRLALKPPVFGAYTMLFAGFSDRISNGCWVIPWGEVATPRKDIDESCQFKEGDVQSVAEQFWDWTEKQVAAYA